MRIAVMVSGSGSNLQALLDAQLAGTLAPAEISLVISNVAGVAALARAQNAAVSSVTIAHGDYPSRQQFEDQLLEVLAKHAIDAVVLAGFMRVLTAHFVEKFPLRIVNTHPSLLPAFPGNNGAAQALAHGTTLAGCTIHFVDASLDGGPIIAQRAVPVLATDDATSLQRRIQAAEHELLPQVVCALAQGLLSCEGRRVRWAQPAVFQGE